MFASSLFIFVLLLLVLFGHEVPNSNIRIYVNCQTTITKSVVFVQQPPSTSNPNKFYLFPSPSDFPSAPANNNTIYILENFTFTKNLAISNPPPNSEIHIKNSAFDAIVLNNLANLPAVSIVLQNVTVRGFVRFATSQYISNGKALEYIKFVNVTDCTFLGEKIFTSDSASLPSSFVGNENITFDIDEKRDDAIFHFASSIRIFQSDEGLGDEGTKFYFINNTFRVSGTYRAYSPAIGLLPRLAGINKYLGALTNIVIDGNNIEIDHFWNPVYTTVPTFEDPQIYPNRSTNFCNNLWFYSLDRDTIQHCRLGVIMLYSYQNFGHVQYLSISKNTIVVHENNGTSGILIQAGRLMNEKLPNDNHNIGNNKSKTEIRLDDNNVTLFSKFYESYNYYQNEVFQLACKKYRTGIGLYGSDNMVNTDFYMNSLILNTYWGYIDEISFRNNSVTIVDEILDSYFLSTKVFAYSAAGIEFGIAEESSTVQLIDYLYYNNNSIVMATTVSAFCISEAFINGMGDNSRKRKLVEVGSNNCTISSNDRIVGIALSDKSFTGGIEVFSVHDNFVSSPLLPSSKTATIYTVKCSTIPLNVLAPVFCDTIFRPYVFFGIYIHSGVTSRKDLNAGKTGGFHDFDNLVIENNTIIMSGALEAYSGILVRGDPARNMKRAMLRSNTIRANDALVTLSDKQSDNVISLSLIGIRWTALPTTSPESGPPATDRYLGGPMNIFFINNTIEFRNVTAAFGNPTLRDSTITTLFGIQISPTVAGFDGNNYLFYYPNDARGHRIDGGNVSAWIFDNNRILLARLSNQCIQSGASCVAIQLVQYFMHIGDVNYTNNLCELQDFDQCAPWVGCSSLGVSYGNKTLDVGLIFVANNTLNVTRSKEKENRDVNNYYRPSFSSSSIPASEEVSRSFSVVKLAGVLGSSNFVVKIDFPTLVGYVVKPMALDVNSLIIKNNTFEIFRRTQTENLEEIERIPADSSMFVKERFSLLALTSCGLMRIQHVSLEENTFTFDNRFSSATTTTTTAHSNAQFSTSVSVIHINSVSFFTVAKNELLGSRAVVVRAICQFCLTSIDKIVVLRKNNIQIHNFDPARKTTTAMSASSSSTSIIETENRFGDVSSKFASIFGAPLFFSLSIGKTLTFNYKTQGEDEFTRYVPVTQEDDVWFSLFFQTTNYNQVISQRAPWFISAIVDRLQKYWTNQKLFATNGIIISDQNNILLNQAFGTVAAGDASNVNQFVQLPERVIFNFRSINLTLNGTIEIENSELKFTSPTIVANNNQHQVNTYFSSSSCTFFGITTTVADFSTADTSRYIKNFTVESVIFSWLVLSASSNLLFGCENARNTLCFAFTDSFEIPWMLTENAKESHLQKKTNQKTESASLLLIRNSKFVELSNNNDDVDAVLPFTIFVGSSTNENNVNPSPKFSPLDFAASDFWNNITISNNSFVASSGLGGIIPFQLRLTHNNNNNNFNFVDFLSISDTIINFTNTRFVNYDSGLFCALINFFVVSSSEDSSSSSSLDKRWNIANTSVFIPKSNENNINAFPSSIEVERKLKLLTSSTGEIPNSNINNNNIQFNFRFKINCSRFVMSTSSSRDLRVVSPFYSIPRTIFGQQSTSTKYLYLVEVVSCFDSPTRSLTPSISIVPNCLPDFAIQFDGNSDGDLSLKNILDSPSRTFAVNLIIVPKAVMDTPAPLVSGKRFIPANLIPLPGLEQSATFTIFNSAAQNFISFDHFAIVSADLSGRFGASNVEFDTSSLSTIGVSPQTILDSLTILGGRVKSPLSISLEVKIDASKLPPSQLSFSSATPIHLKFAINSNLFACVTTSARKEKYLFNQDSYVSDVVSILPRTSRRIPESNLNVPSGLASFAEGSSKVSLILAGSAVGGAMAKAGAIVQFADCSFSMYGPMQFVENIFGLGFGNEYGFYRRGSLIGNALFLVIIAFVLFVIAASRVFASRQIPQKWLQENIDTMTMLETKLKQKQFGSTEERRTWIERLRVLKEQAKKEEEKILKWSHALYLCKLPSSLTIPINILAQGTFSSAIGLVAVGYDGKDRLLGLLFIIFWLGWLFWMLHVVFVQMKKYPWVRFVKKEDDPRRFLGQDQVMSFGSDAHRSTKIMFADCPRCRPALKLLKEKEKRPPLLTKREVLHRRSWLYRFEWFVMAHYLKVYGEWKEVKISNRYVSFETGRKEKLDPFFEERRAEQMRKREEEEQEKLEMMKRREKNSGSNNIGLGSRVEILGHDEMNAIFDDSDDDNNKNVRRATKRNLKTNECNSLNHSIAAQKARQKADPTFFPRTAQVYVDAAGHAPWLHCFEMSQSLMIATLSGIQLSLGANTGCEVTTMLITVVNVLPVAIISSLWPYTDLPGNVFSLAAAACICAMSLSTALADLFQLVEFSNLLITLNLALGIFGSIKIGFDVMSLFVTFRKWFLILGFFLLHVTLHEGGLLSFVYDFFKRKQQEKENLERMHQTMNEIRTDEGNEEYLIVVAVENDDDKKVETDDDGKKNWKNRSGASKSWSF